MSENVDFEIFFGDDEISPPASDCVALGDVPQISAHEDSPSQKFLDFDSENPQIWAMFCQFSMQLIDAGWSRYSADAILHRVRWETAIRGAQDQFKINNNYSAFYARKFRMTFPQHEHFFETRRSKADNSINE